MSTNKNNPSVRKLAPRPTAASTARAARNATNRNLTNGHPQKSPSRLMSSGDKGKTATHNIVQKTDSKMSIKSNLTLGTDYERMTLEHIPKQDTNQPAFINDTHEATILIIEDKMDSDKKAPEKDPKDNTEANIPVEGCNASRPQTPKNQLHSRPQTPKNQVLSRPQTPRLPSRPTTPASHTSASPRQASAHSRPRTPAHTLAPQMKTSSSVAPANLTAAFSTKQKEFLKMKKELDLKQQHVLEAFESLRGIKEHLSSEGVTIGDNIVQKELVVFNVADWSAQEIMQLCRNADAASSPSGSAEIFDNTPAADDQILDDFSGQITDIPAQFADICIQALNTRQEIIRLVKNNMSNKDKDLGAALEKIESFNAHGLTLCEVLREQKVRADTAINSATNFLRKSLQERNALLGAGESLIREISKLKTDLQLQNKISKDVGEVGPTKAIEEARRELEEEKQAKVALKEKLTATEAQLRATRLRITKMDRQLREAEASIGSLTGTVKTLEDQSRQREVQLEARARKLRESLKTGEVSNSHISQQRDLLQAEVKELKEAIATMTEQHKQNLSDLNEELKLHKKSLEEQKEQLEKEVSLKNEMQEALNDSRSQVEALNAKITELETNKPNPELPSEREMDIWAELQATKETLRLTEEEMNLCKREKMRFLDTLSKITESDNKIGMQQKLASELMGKEELIGKMQLQIRELTKNAKLNEQKVIQYEQYVRDLQANSRSIENKDIENGVSYQDLQQEVMNLHMNLLEAAHRNEEMQEMLMQKDQQIEQQEKTSRSQATVIKVREELINMLKSKETQQSRELTALQHDLEHRMKIVEDVNKQIASKAEEIQELFTTLEMKQQQIHRLEKIIIALEEQQRRAQNQRLRNEEKIATLEHELANAGGKRERRFILF